MLLSLSIVAGFSQSAPAWTIRYGSKLLLKVTDENPAKNTVQLNSRDLQKSKKLSISCSEKGSDRRLGKMIRTIGIYTDDDQELMRKESGTISIAGKEFEKMLTTYKSINIFTWLLPADPEQAARVRVRRAHVCTIKI